MRTPLLVLIVGSIGAAACGGSTNGPNQISTSGVPRMAIVSGDSQTVAVTDTLPNPIKVKVTRDGKPVRKQLVDWHVVEQNAGEPFVTTTQTNTDGTTQNRLTAGTWASTRSEIDGPAHLQVRWVDQNTGEAIVDTTVAYIVLPGPPDSWFWKGRKVPTVRVGDMLAFADPDVTGVHITDQYGNPISYDQLTSTYTVSWTIASNCTGSCGTDIPVTGTGWNAGPFPRMETKGWPTGRIVVTVDTTQGNWPPDSVNADGWIRYSTGSLTGGYTTIYAHIPACWVYDQTNASGELQFETTAWSANCPTPQQQAR